VAGDDVFDVMWQAGPFPQPSRSTEVWLDFLEPFSH